MIKKSYKQEVAEKHKAILYAIYHLGKGIMWRSQLSKYMAHFQRMSEPQLSKALTELTAADIIHIHNYLNRRIIRLKKFGVYFLTGAAREETPSISFSSSKAIHSAYVNSILLHTLQEQEDPTTLEAFVKATQKNSTLLSKQKNTHHILLNLMQKAPYKYNWHLLNSHYNMLEAVKNIASAKLHGLELSTVPQVDNEFDLNSMQARNVYIGKWHFCEREDDLHNKILLHGPTVYILDINRKYRYVKKLDNLMTEIRNYLQQILGYPAGLLIRYKLIVEDAHTEAYYHTSEKFEKLLEHHYLDEIEILNLNIVDEVFGGAIILK
ncbi:hypothetical protein MHB42_00740 [Lysinibacillus sp. FSL K6-0232]|uniref:hypothetical protein n=1 Tax=Lysinibacillus sp. FSL K6-0232 TaxID=2921425 RepID=UPI0030FA041C